MSPLTFHRLTLDWIPPNLYTAVTVVIIVGMSWEFCGNITSKNGVVILLQQCIIRRHWGTTDSNGMLEGTAVFQQVLWTS